MRLVIRKSVLLELAKGMNEDSFEKIKAAIIAHLKGLEEQEESGDLKKAITYFSDNESMFSHLEKSLSGEWIEKAGYGIGTVRTWRGKKYKKIAQGKWVRVYDKVDRGAKNAMTRLIHQAENIDTPEEMMRFVLANKQRFSDANGKPLDIVDRLNAVIDNKEYKNESSKKSAANTNKKTPAQPKTGKNTEKPAKTSGNSSFGLDDIKSGKKVKTVAEMEDVAKQIADKYKENGHKAESVWIDFMAYNLDGGMGGDLATDFMQKHGDVNFQTLIKKLSGKKLSAKERNPEFADEYANMEEEKSTKKKKASNASVFSPSDSADIDKKEVIAEPVSQSAGTVEFPKTKEKVSTFKKEDFKSMSDEELKDYEAKLEKELLASNRSEPDYVEKYSHWQEVHQENNDRFHLHLIDEDKAEKQREEEIKAKKEKEIKEKYHGYFDNRKGLEKIRAVKSLEKKYRYGVKVMSNKEFVEQAIENGAEIKEHEVNKLDYPSRVRWNRMNGYEQEQYEKRIKAAGKKTVYTIDGYEFPKDVVDYARFYKEKGKSSRLKEMQKRGISTQVKKSDSLYEYVQKSIAALKACRAI